MNGGSRKRESNYVLQKMKIFESDVRNQNNINDSGKIHFNKGVIHSERTKINNEEDSQLRIGANQYQDSDEETYDVLTSPEELNRHSIVENEIRSQTAASMKPSFEQKGNYKKISNDKFIRNNERTTDYQIEVKERKSVAQNGNNRVEYRSQVPKYNLNYNSALENETIKNVKDVSDEDEDYTSDDDITHYIQEAEREDDKDMEGSNGEDHSGSGISYATSRFAETRVEDIYNRTPRIRSMNENNNSKISSSTYIASNKVENKSLPNNHYLDDREVEDIDNFYVDSREIGTRKSKLLKSPRRSQDDSNRSNTRISPPTETGKKGFIPKASLPPKLISKNIDPEWADMQTSLIQAEMNFLDVYSTISQNQFYNRHKAKNTAKAFEAELGNFEFLLNCHRELLEKFRNCFSSKEYCQVMLCNKENIEQHIQDEWKTLNKHSALKDELLRLSFYNQTNLIIKCYRDVTQRIFNKNPTDHDHQMAFDLVFIVYKQNLAIREGLKLIIGHNISLREVGLVKCQKTVNLIKPSAGFIKKTKSSCIFITETHIIFTEFKKESRNFDFLEAILTDQIVSLDFQDNKEKINIFYYAYQMKKQLTILTTEKKTYLDIKISLES